jgi:hypothetical protein
VIKPKQIEAAVKALEEIERREEAVDNQWRMQIERAEYEANLAQRRYEAVDPDNRLVARTLEKRWNEALLRFEEVRHKFEEHKQKNRISATEDQKAQLLKLVPRLINSVQKFGNLILAIVGTFMQPLPEILCYR